MPTINRALCVSLCVLSAAYATASAQVTVGTAAPNNGNCIPVGCAAQGFNEYQQVYASAAFLGPFNIGSLTFFHTAFNPGTGFYAAGTYDFFFGTTTKPVNGLDPVYASNETSPLSFFASLVIAPGTSAASSTFTVVGNPYLYNPATGNLLLDIKYSNGGSGLTFLDVDRDGVLTSRVAGVSPIGTSAGIGLVTRFDAPSVTATPEPESLSLVAIGLIAVVAFARRRRAGLTD